MSREAQPGWHGRLGDAAADVDTGWWKLCLYCSLDAWREAGMLGINPGYTGPRFSLRGWWKFKCDRCYKRCFWSMEFFAFGSWITDGEQYWGPLE